MSPQDVSDYKMDETLELFRTGGGYHYFMRSEEGLLMSSSPDYAPVFNLWRDGELASEFCRLHNEKYKSNYKVMQIDNRQLPALLKDFRSQGDKYVQLGSSLETSKLISIDDILEVIEKAIKNINVTRFQTDEFVCLQEDRKKAGLDPMDEMDKVLPIDCGNCGASFTVDNATYSQWRLGEKPNMFCPHCRSIFQEGRWGYVKCRSCGAFSGSMPLSFGEHLKKSENGWRCRKCQESDVHAQVEKLLQKYKTSTERVQASGKPASSGCLSLVLISLCVALLIILRL